MIISKGLVPIAGYVTEELNTTRLLVSKVLSFLVHHVCVV